MFWPPPSPVPLSVVATLAFASQVLDDIPKIPPISDDPTVIASVDIVRIGLFVAGLSLAALTVRHAVVLPRYAEPSLFIRGFRSRSAALVAGLLLVSFAAYDRLGTVVSYQILLSLLFVFLAARSAHLATKLPRPPLVGEAELRAHRRPSEADSA